MRLKRLAFLIIAFCISITAEASINNWIGEYQALDQAGNQQADCKDIIIKASDAECSGLVIQGLSDLSNVESQFCQINLGEKKSVMPFDPTHSTSLFMLTQQTVTNENSIQKNWSVSGKVGGIFGGRTQQGQIVLAMQAGQLMLKVVKAGLNPNPFRNTTTCLFTKK